MTMMGTLEIRIYSNTFFRNHYPGWSHEILIPSNDADIAVLEIQGTLVKGLNVYSNEMFDFDGYDTVVLAAVNVADDSLYFELKDKVDEIYRVGDCVAPRKTDMAIIEGRRVGEAL